MSKSESWLDQRVFEELNCYLEDSLKCAILLLKEDAYQWWVTLVVMVPKDCVTWEFFRIEFRKKYVSNLYLKTKKREFMDLK